MGGDVNQGSSTIESVSSGSSWDTESSIVPSQSSDGQSGGHYDCSRTVVDVRHEPPALQQQQQQETPPSYQLSSAYDERSQLLLTPI